MTTAHARRLALALVATGFMGLVGVLGLWQGVDEACDGGGFDPADPVATCEPPAEANQGRVSPDPPRAVPVSR